MAKRGVVAYASCMDTGPLLPAHLWDGLPPEAQALISALRAEVTELQAEVSGLQRPIQELEKQMSRDTISASASPCPDRPTAKRPPPESPPGGVTTPDSGLSPRDRLRELVHQSPRLFNKPRSTWTLHLLAEVCFEAGIVNRRVSASTVGRELQRMGIGWKQSRLWQTSPDPQYALKKARRDRLIEVSARHPDWVLGFADEVWWSRLHRPRMQAWADGPALKMNVLTADDWDPDPIAICCYGILRNDTKKVMLRFAEDRPVGEVTVLFLEWLCQMLHEEGKKRLIVIWDDAPWHASMTVLDWIREHNCRVTVDGGVEGVEIIHFELPVRSPWLNNIEPCYMWAKRAIVEPGRKLSAQEIVIRVCQHFACQLLPYRTSATRS
jgi:hypothetical protein